MKLVIIPIGCAVLLLLSINEMRFYRDLKERRYFFLTATYPEIYKIRLVHTKFSGKEIELLLPETIDYVMHSITGERDPFNVGKLEAYKVEFFTKKFGVITEFFNYVPEYYEGDMLISTRDVDEAYLFFRFDKDHFPKEMEQIQNLIYKK